MNLSMIFEQFSQKLKNLSCSDIEKLEHGFFDIQIKDGLNKKPTKDLKHSTDINRVSSDLSNTKSREEAFELLEKSELTLKELGVLSKQLELAYRKGESKRQVIERIVEKTVGFKLNSEAIRGSSQDADTN